MIFNKWRPILDEIGSVDWEAIAFDGSNIRTLKAAVGAKKYPNELEEHEPGRSQEGGTVHLATSGQDYHCVYV